MSTTEIYATAALRVLIEHHIKWFGPVPSKEAVCREAWEWAYAMQNTSGEITQEMLDRLDPEIKPEEVLA